ncbi:TPA: hypothetical protein HA310_03015, partial [Candidatus Micrarchaeota archaeon]|nr:hypothetical protein [Candidatus Micrarchaeota archaeon]
IGQNAVFTQNMVANNIYGVNSLSFNPSLGGNIIGVNVISFNGFSQGVDDIAGVNIIKYGAPALVQQRYTSGTAAQTLAATENIVYVLVSNGFGSPSTQKITIVDSPSGSLVNAANEVYVGNVPANTLMTFIVPYGFYFSATYTGTVAFNTIQLK